MPVSVTVNSERAIIGLDKFALGIRQNDELMRQIGAGMLVSVRRTFRDEGVPAGSWPRLSPNTVRTNPRIYGAGHKLLVRSGALLNSITYRVMTGAVEVGTSIRYAAVHQFGSRDYGYGARTLAQDQATAKVGAYSYRRLQAELGTTLLRGRKRKIQGPRGMRNVNVRGHERHQNIPPRPFLVFRPEDPARIRGIVQRYIAAERDKAGLGGAQ